MSPPPSEATAGRLVPGGLWLAAFFVIAVGVAPGWLYGFLPEKAGFYPYNWDRLIRHGELAAVALLAQALPGFLPHGAQQHDSLLHCSARISP